MTSLTEQINYDDIPEPTPLDVEQHRQLVSCLFNVKMDHETSKKILIELRQAGKRLEIKKTLEEENKKNRKPTFFQRLFGVKS